MRRAFLALPLALLIGAAAPRSFDPGLNARVFDRAWTLVEKHYWNRALMADPWLTARERYRSRIVAAPDRRTLYTLLGEMLATLGDSHVYAIDPAQLAIGRARDRTGGDIGFGFEMLPDAAGDWRVQSVRADGPAAHAGVEIGWIVAAVNGAPVDIDFQPVVGQRVAFAFVDERGARHATTVAATEEAALPVRRAVRLPGNLLLLALDGFDPGADRWMAGELAKDPAPAGVIVDLRANDGGDADVIARVAGLFFARDRVLVRRIGSRSSDQMTQGAGPYGWLGPLAVLIGPDSASGAEAFAALIDESRRGITVGERSAGALTGAALYRLPDGGELSVSDFDIRTPAGVRLEGIGLVPRVPVTPSLADRRAGRDPVLDRARRLLSGG